jgi:hypothetical protein
MPVDVGEKEMKTITCELSVGEREIIEKIALAYRKLTFLRRSAFLSARLTPVFTSHPPEAAGDVLVGCS